MHCVSQWSVSHIRTQNSMTSGACATSVYTFAFWYRHGHAHVRTCCTYIVSHLTRKNLQHTHMYAYMHFCVRSTPVLVHVRSGQIQLFTTPLILCQNMAEPQSTLCPYRYTVMSVTLRSSYQHLSSKTLQ